MGSATKVSGCHTQKAKKALQIEQNATVLTVAQQVEFFALKLCDRVTLLYSIYPGEQHEPEIEGETLYDVVDINSRVDNVTINATGFDITCGYLMDANITEPRTDLCWTVNFDRQKQYMLYLTRKLIHIFAKLCLTYYFRTGNNFVTNIGKIQSPPPGQGYCQLSRFLQHHTDHGFKQPCSGSQSQSAYEYFRRP
jgi:hypothetical protein